MFLGYNTNGLAHHDLFDAVELLAEIGYRGVAITIDHNALPPRGPNAGQQIAGLGRLLERLGMRSVIETGAPISARSASEARADAAFRWATAANRFLQVRN